MDSRLFCFEAANRFCQTRPLCEQNHMEITFYAVKITNLLPVGMCDQFTTFGVIGPKRHNQGLVLIPMFTNKTLF